MFEVSGSRWWSAIGWRTESLILLDRVTIRPSFLGHVLFWAALQVSGWFFKHSQFIRVFVLKSPFLTFFQGTGQSSESDFAEHGGV